MDSGTPLQPILGSGGSGMPLLEASLARLPGSISSSASCGRDWPDFWQCRDPLIQDKSPQRCARMPTLQVRAGRYTSTCTTGAVATPGATSPFSGTEPLLIDKSTVLPHAGQQQVISKVAAR